MKIRYLLMGVMTFALLGLVQESFAKVKYYVDNGTPYRAQGTIHYATKLCKDDNFDLAPGADRGFSAGICDVTSVEARLLNVPINPIPGQPVNENATEVPVAPYTSYQSAVYGNQTFGIYGPVEYKYHIGKRPGH